jgi:hypothetical protein
MRLALLALPLIGVIGCGGGSGGADAAPPMIDALTFDAPPATGTLLVVGTFTVENTNNGVSGMGLHVDCDLRITKGGNPVTNALVTVNPAIPSFMTVLPGQATDPSHYVGSYMGYFDTAKITITTPTDVVPQELLVGPKLYQITMPSSGATVPSGTDLTVHWDTPEGAVTSADITLMSGYSSTGQMDSGLFTIPGTKITVMNDKVTVTRWRDTTLAGGAPGSVIHFGVASSQPFHAM